MMQELGSVVDPRQSRVFRADAKPCHRAMTLAEDVRLWSLADDTPPVQMAANSQGLVTAALRPDSKQVATGDAG